MRPRVYDKRGSIERSLALHQMYSESNFLLINIIDDNLAITLLLPRGKWRLQALGLVSYQAGSHMLLSEYI